MGQIDEIFLPSPSLWVKKKSNSTHMHRVRSGWTHGFNNFFITIIIKLSRKKKNITPTTWVAKQNIY